MININYKRTKILFTVHSVYRNFIRLCLFINVYRTYLYNSCDTPPPSSHLMVSSNYPWSSPSWQSLVQTDSCGSLVWYERTLAEVWCSAFGTGSEVDNCKLTIDRYMFTFLSFNRIIWASDSLGTFCNLYKNI